MEMSFSLFASLPNLNSFPVSSSRKNIQILLLDPRTLELLRIAQVYNALLVDTDHKVSTTCCSFFVPEYVE
jgi:hypothetical protein